MSVASRTAQLRAKVYSPSRRSHLPALGVALWRNKWKILWPTLLMMLATFVVVQVITPKYLGETRVLVETRGNVFLRPDVDKMQVDRDAVDEVAVTSQAQLVLSRDLALDVIAKLGLNERAEFDPTLSGASPVTTVLAFLGLTKNPARLTAEERVLDSYYDRLAGLSDRKSRVIVIDFLSRIRNLQPPSPMLLPKSIWCASAPPSRTRRGSPPIICPAKSRRCKGKSPRPKPRWNISSPGQSADRLEQHDALGTATRRF